MTPARISYGDHPDQYGELWQPAGSSQPGVLVVIHGGFWRARYDASLGRPLAADLAARGWVAWNIEYRRAGAGGGWPVTLDDVAAAVDHLAALDVDTSRVVAIGHSAGGQLAAWAAGRGDARVPISGVVSQAGVLDLVTAARSGVGHTAVADLLGGLPDDVADRYAAADPMQHVPLPVPVVCVHARADDEVPFEMSERYVAAAARADAQLVEAAGDHYTLIDPRSPDWQLCVAAGAHLLERGE